MEKERAKKESLRPHSRYDFDMEFNKVEKYRWEHVYEGYKTYGKVVISNDQILQGKNEVLAKLKEYQATLSEIKSNYGRYMLKDILSENIGKIEKEIENMEKVRPAYKTYTCDYKYLHEFIKDKMENRLPRIIDYVCNPQWASQKKHAKLLEYAAEVLVSPESFQLAKAKL